MGAKKRLPKEEVTLKELAELWKCSTRTIRRYVEDHGLPCTKLSSKHWLFSPDDIEAWKQERRTN
jgi:excisionase family DNA binding protein